MAAWHFYFTTSHPRYKNNNNRSELTRFGLQDQCGTTVSSSWQHTRTHGCVKGHRQFFSVLAAHRPWLGSQQMGIWLQSSTLQHQRIIYLVVSSSSVLLHLRCIIIDGTSLPHHHLLPVLLPRRMHVTLGRRWRSRLSIVNHRLDTIRLRKPHANW